MYTFKLKSLFTSGGKQRFVNWTCTYCPVLIYRMEYGISLKERLLWKRNTPRFHTEIPQDIMCISNQNLSTSEVDKQRIVSCTLWTVLFESLTDCYNMKTFSLIKPPYCRGTVNDTIGHSVQFTIQNLSTSEVENSELFNWTCTYCPVWIVNWRLTIWKLSQDKASIFRTQIPVRAFMYSISQLKFIDFRWKTANC